MIERQQVAVSNVYSDSNRGGALLTLACVTALESIFPSAGIVLIPTSPSPAAADYELVLTKSRATLLPGGVVHLEGHRYWPAVLSHVSTALSYRSGLPLAPPARGPGYEALVESSIVVGKGGQMFRNYKGPRGVRSFLSSAAPLMVASGLGIPTALYGVQIGPYRDIRSERAAARVLSRISLVLARDSVSAEIASELGAGRVELIPDTLFVLDSGQLIADETWELGRFDVLIMSKALYFSLGPEGRAAIVAVFRKRLINNMADWLVITAQSDADHMADFKAAADMAQDIDHSQVSFIGELLPASRLLALYRDAALTVSGRVHGGLMSVLVGTPAVVVDTSTNKATDLFRSMSLSNHVIRAGPDMKTELDSRLMEFDANRAAISCALKEKVTSMRRELKRAGRLLHELTT